MLYSVGISDRDNRFRPVVHYVTSEDMLAGIAGDRTKAEGHRNSYTQETVDIKVQPGGPFSYTGFGFFRILLHPRFIVDNPEGLPVEAINPRFPVVVASKDAINAAKGVFPTEVELEESWGFPADYTDAREYFPLAAKILTAINGKMGLGRDLIIVRDCFYEIESHYDRAVKRLSLVGLLHDLTGKWINFGTSPNVGEYESALVFMDPMFEQTRYQGRKTVKEIAANHGQLTETESVIVKLLEERLSPENRNQSPKAVYTQLQTDIAEILNQQK